ncbi:MAG: outer membrane beta-barrel protein [Alphaproteobacteria bacterium]|nr:outer membrane beta-barrel protein [Alphaproteobacteria bacterium]
MRLRIFLDSRVGMAALAGLLSLAGPVIAADYDTPSPNYFPPQLQDKVNFASNWYVRGDLAFAEQSFPTLTTPSLSSTGGWLNSYSIGAGLGYKVNDHFRTDLTLDYRSKFHASGIGPETACGIVLPNVITGIPEISQQNCFGHYNTVARRWDLLANAYLDLASWNGFTPYVGVGAGVTWAYAQQSVFWALGNGTQCYAACGFPTPPSGTLIFNDFDSNWAKTSYHFAFAAMAGLSIAVTEHAAIDIGYRFLDLGSTPGIATLFSAPVNKTLYVNEIRGGIRYMID